MNLALKVAAGIILLAFAGCSGSNSGVAIDAGSTAGGTGQSTGVTQPSGGNSGGGTGGSTSVVGETGSSSSEGGKAGSTVGSSTAGTSATGAAGSAISGGTTSSTAGGQGGRSTVGTGTGGAAGVGGASDLGGSALAGKTSTTVTGGTSNGGGSTGGTSSTGGVTTVGTRTGPVFPARFVGNLDTAGKIRPDFSKYWDQFTPESAGFWASVQGGSNTFNWSTLDAMVQYTQENNIIFKESCFIWGAGPPGWVNSDNIVGAAQAWMKTFCERYPNTRLIDVVNEPLHMTPGYAKGLGGGAPSSTLEWVANSFKMAREACPNAVLILNDYNICEYETDHQKFLSLVSTLKKLEAPIDAIGCQSHDAAKVSVAKFKGYLDALASQTGLPIYITEFDIGLADDEKQRAQYADYFTMFWDDPNVKGATIWGYIMGRTWRSDTGIMSTEGTMRPAMSWLMDFLKR